MVYRGGCGSPLDGEFASPSVTMSVIEVDATSRIGEGATRWRILLVLMCR
jgi:hypothetical protein